MEIDITLDVKKKSCPVPVLLTRQKLEEMESGQILQVIVDLSVSIENIRRFAVEHGHEILRIDDKRTQYEVFIKKK